jgi:hypothetical protein
MPLNKVLSPIKKASFYLIMLAIIFPPLLATVGLFAVSFLTYDTLNHPNRHDGSSRVWVQIAQYIWQNQRDCVRYDEKLLYIPSKGCKFSNIEFSTTTLTFSDDGRVIDTNNTKKGPPILILGDSGSMGWGVNDTETYSYAMGLGTAVPILNLAVSSYGMARELIRARRHPMFRYAKCLLIQYSGNDLEENGAFLSPEGLPHPTPERFEFLLRHHSRKLSFLEVAVKTSEYMWEYSSHFWGDLIGWRLVSKPTTKSERQSKIAIHAKLFLAVLQRFPELAEKTIFVINLSLSEIAPTDLPTNVVPIKVDYSSIGYGYFYPLDMHQNKLGHQEIAKQVLERMKQHAEGRACLSAQ